ncbi:1-aminocyclopropane-1-carboxylate deaminase/D-cysteine desulfhydrase [Paucilactobacillus nenjiangensis]|uniref:1-aminocyclopropane-1-carboxylate deaminase/D-cysteine desulfhydrase n=1 Tax=Paucilactobacillus nenjiangensis TaxID=1296540 RepID=UPI003BAE583F
MNKTGKKLTLTTVARANILLDKIFGAEIHYISMDGRTEAEADAIGLKQAQDKAADLEKHGHKAYLIPMGGATSIGSAGFVQGFKELTEQLPDTTIDYVFHGSGTGGTAAGLIAGAKAFSNPDHPTKVVSINVSPKPIEHYQTVVDMGNDALHLLNIDATISVDDTHFDQAYFGDGYEIPSDSGTAAIKYLAQKEGILTDPVYTGKAFAGLLDYVKQGKVPAGSNVVFWHTDGISALFAEQQMVGKLY